MTTNRLPMLALGLLSLSACGGGDATLGSSMSDASSTGTLAEESGEGLSHPGGQLTAGEWRDLDNWAFWLDITGTSGGALFGLGDQWGVRTDGRHSVVVQDDLGAPLADAGVDLIDANGLVLWSARTDNQGRAELFEDFDTAAPAGALTLDVHSGTALTTGVPTQGGFDATTVVIAGAHPAQALDVMFVIDTTGSMEDELRYLAAELRDVVDRVAVERANVDLRLATVFYRDHGDLYVAEGQAFTRDVDIIVNDLGTRVAGGGGDWPEAVDEGLSNALDGHNWSQSATSRLLFLVLDAPPHESAAARIQLQLRQAAEMGIRIVPVAASGVDKDTEALLRRMDIATGATYTFLTDDSGLGNDHLEPSVGDFQVEYLNDLLVRLIAASID